MTDVPRPRIGERIIDSSNAHMARFAIEYGTHAQTHTDAEGYE